MPIKGEVSICISGPVVISNIADAHGLLSGAFDRDGAIVVDLEGVTDADITLAQLLEAARRSAALGGRSIRLSKPADGPVLQLLQRGGFLDSSDPERVAFWLQGATPQ